jgi:hypothetical protein
MSNIIWHRSSSKNNYTSITSINKNIDIKNTDNKVNSNNDIFQSSALDRIKDKIHQTDHMFTIENKLQNNEIPCPKW